VPPGALDGQWAAHRDGTVLVTGNHLRDVLDDPDDILDECHAQRSTDATLPPQVLRPPAVRAMLTCMTAQHHHEPPLTDRPAETLAAIRAALAASAVPEVLAQYETELDAAFAQARETGDLTVLTTAVRRWWIEALEWQRNPAGQRDFLARMERYLTEGPPGPEHRITREEFRAQLGV